MQLPPDLLQGRAAERPSTSEIGEIPEATRSARRFLRPEETDGAVLSVTNGVPGALTSVMNGCAVARVEPRVEERTVEAARSGAAAAWQELFDAHYPKLYRFFRTRVVSPEDAEDLAAEVFAEAFRSLGTFRWRNRPFESWLYGIARNRLRMHYRGRRETAEMPEDAGQVRNEFLSVEIEDVLARLPANYREAIELRYALGLTGTEAAAAMGRSHGSFRTLLSRATEAFRREYRRET